MGNDNAHFDVVLANAAVEYRNKKYIAGEVVPVMPVPFQSGFYTVFDKKDRFTRAKTIIGPKDYNNQVDWNTSEDPYACDDHGLADFLTDKKVKNNNKIRGSLRVRIAERLTDLLLLEREILAATLAFTYANFGASYRITLSGADQFSQPTTSDPFGVIDTAKAACFTDPNVIVMGKQVFDKLKRHPALLDHVKGGGTTSNPAKITAELMAEIFEVDKVIVGAAKYNTANKGQTASFDYIWGKHILCAYVDPAVDIDGITWAKCFGEEYANGAGNVRVKSTRDERKGGGGEWIDVNMSMRHAVVCSDIAYLIKDAIA